MNSNFLAQTGSQTSAPTVITNVDGTVSVQTTVVTTVGGPTVWIPGLAVVVIVVFIFLWLLFRRRDSK